MGAFWIFLLNYNHKRSVLFLLGGFNAVIYLIFLVLIILFETLPQSKEESQCEGREPSQIDNTNTKIVSIVYQSLMAGISVFLALFIFSAGAKLFFGLKQKMFEKKVALVTLICTVGLLLHCSFILYLSATFSDDFTIIVLMIVMSELVPISFIMFQFSIMRAACFGKIKIPSYNRARMLSTLQGHGSSPTATIQPSIPSSIDTKDSTKSTKSSEF